LTREGNAMPSDASMTSRYRSGAKMSSPQTSRHMA
jgi:hypothetical protein